MQIKLFITQSEALRLAKALSQTMHPNIKTLENDKILLNNLEHFGHMILQANVERK